ncbi:hypothetical protein H310_05086 [Aphanomyces invadans]|uniref:RING-type domain-containing protein n=1 Tax=Aphanomyces invadans TaxID=157072 RepID=A0A024UDI4_9STRA|nr:hypothetical protein H310_05086 [Aphanomyces invadans]ETW03703.1 hypothetical protein H310_05086 [Aphanomyces invadans]|eukprot:XP_008867932.1 hypothetical protein H310_05086 [Aphanomyces invadans]
MASAEVGDTMQVVWVDMATKRGGGTVEISLSDVRHLDNMTVYDLKQVLATKLRLSASTQVDLKLYGHSLPSGRASAYLPFLRVNAPRFVLAFTKRAATMPLFVKTISGRTVCLHVYAHETIGQVKAMLEDKDAIPVASRRLVYGGVELADWHTVSRYNIQPNATLHGLARLVGGSAMHGGPAAQPTTRSGGTVKFADVGNPDMMEVVSFSSAAPAWRCVGHGLNLMATCVNCTCDAFGSTVYIPQGFRPFNILEHRSRCPACDECVSPMSCGFYKCLWRFEGTKAGMHMSSGWNAAEGNVFHQYKSEGSSMVAWESLVVVARALKMKECVVCFEELRDLGVTSLLCNHRIHSTCLTQWTSSCRARHAHVTCPLCRARLS